MLDDHGVICENI